MRNKKFENQIDKIGFQNFKTEPTFLIFEDRTNLIDFGSFGLVCRFFSVLLIPLLKCE